MSARERVLAAIAGAEAAGRLVDLAEIVQRVASDAGADAPALSGSQVERVLTSLRREGLADTRPAGGRRRSWGLTARGSARAATLPLASP